MTRTRDVLSWTEDVGGMEDLWEGHARRRMFEFIGSVLCGSEGGGTK